MRRARHLLTATWERLRTELWFVPALFVAGVVVLAVVVARLDDALRAVSWLRFPGGSQSARSLLSSIAGAMITFTGLVFSITVLVLQLASQQFSPRVLRTFLRDRTSQVALGMFVATFTYALIVLRQVTPASVPSLSVTTAAVLVLVSTGVFVHYISHIAQGIRVSTIVSRIGKETAKTIDREYPERAEEHPRPARNPGDSNGPNGWIRARRPGVLTEVDVSRLVEMASELDVTFEVMRPIGAFVPTGATIVAVHGGELDAEQEQDASELFTIDPERSMLQDVGFGIRQLVDIAERALSPSLNDPTTAVQAVDMIHDILQRLATRPFPPDGEADEEGTVRVLLRRPSWDDYVTLAVTELRMYGAGSVQVHRRLRAMLRELLEVAPPSRRPPLARELELLDRTAARAFDMERDVLLARDDSDHGLG